MTTESTPPTPPVEELNLRGMEFQLFQEFARVKTPEGIWKAIRLSDLAEVLLSFLKASASSRTEVLQIPEGTFSIRSGANSKTVYMYFPETVKQVTYLSHELRIKVPNIVVIVPMSVLGGEYKIAPNSVTYLCTPLSLSQIPRDIDLGVRGYLNKNFFYLPFNNCYDTANLCFGGTSVPTTIPLSDWRGLVWYYQLLWESPFNNDLGIRTLTPHWSDKINLERSNHGHYYPWYAHLSKIAEAGETFPYSELRHATE